MRLGPGEWAVILLSAVLLAGYGAGYVLNRRRAQELVLWLQRGLSPWGTVQAGGKLPGLVTGGRLRVPAAAAPFRHIEVTYVLAPRENLPFWVIHRLRGKGDEVLVHITARRRPRLEVRVLPRSGTAAPTLYDQGRAFARAFSTPTYHVYCRGELPCPEEVLRGMLQLLPEGIHAFAVHEESPHVRLRVDARPLVARSPQEVWDTLARVAGEAIKKPTEQVM